MAWDRKERLEALLKEKIAIIVLERLNDPRLGFVTITGVKLSGDKRYAKVLYTVLGTEGQRRTTGRALQDAARHVQEQLAPSLRMRIMPELRFTYDESIVKESRMLDLLDDLATRRTVSPGSAQDSLAESEANAERDEAAEADDGPDEDAATEGGDDEAEDDIDTDDDIDDAPAREDGNDPGAARGDDDPRTGGSAKRGSR